MECYIGDRGKIVDGGWQVVAVHIFCVIITLCSQKNVGRDCYTGKFMTFNFVTHNSHNISTRTVRSAGGTSLVFDAWHT